MAKTDLLGIYELLFSSFGGQNWWPADSPFEVCVGAILTQSTSWSNVEKAISNLKNERLLSPEGINKCPVNKLAVFIKPAGYFNAKAKKLKAFTKHLSKHYDSDLSSLLSKPVPELRQELLSIYGIGPETADSMILYAAEKPCFVVDAYTRRVFYRLGFVREDIDYEGLKSFSEKNLPSDVDLFNEFHALIVRLGKEHCRKTKQVCLRCPLSRRCRNNRK